MNIVGISALGLLFVFLTAPFVDADVHVKGYYRKNGTYVAPYTRRSPGSGSSHSTSSSGRSSGASIGSSSAPLNSTAVTTAPSPLPAPVEYEDPEVSAERARKNLPGIVAWQLENAVKGYDSAQLAVGMRYLKGDGLDKDEVLARQWLLKSAKQGNNDAYEVLRNADFWAECVDDNGRVIQSTSARHDFMVKSGFPKGKMGNVCDYIMPVEKGGSDIAPNLRWLPISEAREKETWEGYLPLPIPVEKGVE